MDFATLKIERSVDGVASRGKSEPSLGLTGVEMQDEFLRRSPRNRTPQKKDGSAAHDPPNSPS